MPFFSKWSLSQESRARMAELLKSAGELGLDPDAVAADGLAALRALIALNRAKDAEEGAGGISFLRMSKKPCAASTLSGTARFCSKCKAV